MNRTIITIILLAIAFAVGKGFKSEPVVKLVPIKDPNYIQNPCEAQERLKEQGWYNGKIDGKWGPQTDKAYCNYMAVQAFKEADHEQRNRKPIE